MPTSMRTQTQKSEFTAGASAVSDIALTLGEKMIRLIATIALLAAGPILHAEDGPIVGVARCSPAVPHLTVRLRNDLGITSLEGAAT